MEFGTRVSFRVKGSARITVREFWQSKVTQEFAPDKVTHGERAVWHVGAAITDILDWFVLEPITRD